MCKNYNEENISTDNPEFQMEEEDEVIETNSGKLIIPKDAFISYIKSLGGQSQDEFFITPFMAIKVIDFVHRLSHGTATTSEEADKLVHSWYKEKVNEKQLKPFNQRTKNIEEIMACLKTDCNLKDVIVEE